MSGANGPSRREALVLAAAAVPFLASLALLGWAFNTGALLAFAIGWPLLQVFGYVGATRYAGGAVDYPLVHTQIALHWMMLALFAALVARVT